jgi:hypothetical protein
MSIHKQIVPFAPEHPEFNPREHDEDDGELAAKFRAMIVAGNNMADRLRQFDLGANFLVKEWKEAIK